MKKLLRLFEIGLLFSLIAFFSFSSCEIGLGEAVDTKAPEIAISFPDVDTVIRDTFAIQGNWSDDGDLDTIEVVLSRTDGQKKYGPYAAEFQNNEEKKGNWKCVITPTDENNRIIDGTYEVEITVKDLVGHVSKTTRQFSIDNTPPLLILQRPFTEISVSDANTEEYGQLFSLEGQVSDDSNVDHIDINVYRDSAYTSFIKTITIHNPPSTINIDAAVFTEGEQNDYSDIYGYTSISEAENAGQLSAVRYCKIVTYDKAQRYPVENDQTAEDTKGNQASSFYIYDDVNTSDLLGQYKITELYKMNNGTYLLGDSSRSAAGVTSALSSLESKKRETSKFRLNPKNNPTFEVSGKQAFSGKRGNFSIDSESQARISNESTVVIDVKPGLDNYTINKDLLRPYLIPCNEDGSLLLSDVESNRIYLTTAGDCEKNGSSYKFAVPLKTGMVSQRFATEDSNLYSNSNTLLIGGYYCFGMEGSDIKGKSVVSTGYYAFKFESNGSLNTIKDLQIKIDNGEYESKDIIYAKENTQISIKGVANSSDPSISDDGKITVKFDGTPVQVDKDGSQILENGYYKQKFTASFNVGTKTNESEYSLIINASEDSTQVTIPVNYDSVTPAVIIGEPSPYDYIHMEVGEDSSKKYLNKTISVNINVSDNDSVKTATAELQIKNGADWNTLKTIPTQSGFANWNINVDTSSVDNCTVRLKVTAIDRSGNTKEEFSPEYKVLQKSDNPTAKPGDDSLTLTADTSSYEFKSNNKNLRSSGGNISFAVFDDDGIKNAELKLFSKDNENTVINSSKLYTEDKNKDTSKKTDNISFRLLNSGDSALEQGTYKLTLSVTDIYDVSNSYNFYVKVTAAAPVIRIENVVSKVTTNTADVTSDCKNTLENKIYITSTATKFKVERRIAGVANGNYVEICSETSDKEITDSIGPGVLETKTSGEYSIDYRVTDEENQNTVQTTHFYVDNEKPEITLLTIPTKEETENTTGDFKGTTQETNTSAYQSGVTSVEYKIGNDGTVRTAIIENGKWTATVTYKDEAELYSENKYSQGTKTAYIRAVDQVGNISAWTPVNFTFDRKPPVATITTEPFNYGYKFSIKGKAYEDTSELSGTSTANLSAVTDWVVTQKKTGVTDPITFSNGITYDSDTKEWTIADLPRKKSGQTTEFDGTNTSPYKATEGEYEYTIKVKDWSGKTTDSNSIKVVVDHTPPVLTPFTVDAEIKGASKTFAITAHDNNGNAHTGVKAVWYAFTINNTAPAKGATDYKKVENDKIRRELGTGPYTVTPNTATTLYEGQHYLHLYVEDNAGNTSAIETKSFYVDQSIPEVILTDTLKNAYYLNKATGNELSLEGTITETNELSSFIVKRDGTEIKVTPQGAASPVSIFTIGTDTNVANRVIKSNPSGDSWKYLDTGIAEGKHTYTFEATDVRSHKNATLSKEVFVDTVEPTISSTATEFTVPKDNETESEYFTFKGTKDSIIDSGNANASGIDKILIGFSDDTSSLTAPQTEPVVATINPEGDWYYTLEFAQYSVFSELNNNVRVYKEGPKKVWIKAYDKAGNETNWKTIDFVYDVSSPAITETGLNKNGLLKKDTFTLSGTASDSYGIKNISVYRKNGATNVELFNYTPAANTNVTTYNWSKEVKLESGKSGNGNTLDDGEYKFYISITDKADKNTTIERTVTVDTTAPTIPTGGITITNTTAANASAQTPQEVFAITADNAPRKNQTWLNTRTIKISVSPDADNLTGVDTVSYTLADAATRSEGSWIDLTKQSSGNYTGNIALTKDGASTVYFRVKDKAGNTSSVYSSEYKVDTTKPTIGKLYNASGKELTGELLVDGVNGADFKVYLDVTDSGDTASTGVMSITYNGNAAGNTTKKITVGEEEKTLYEITIEKAKQVNGDLTFVATDYVNNTQSYTPLTLKVDAKAPTITNIKVNATAPVSNAISGVNGNITVSATVADKFDDTTDGRLKNISVLYSIDNTNWYAFGDDDTVTTSSAKENLSITHRFSSPEKLLKVEVDSDSSKLVLADEDTTTQKQSVWFKITATDEANHTVTSTPVKIEIDRDTDIPEIKFANVTMSTTMSSSNHVWLLNTTQLQGTVTDDDGISSIEVSVDGTNWETATLDDNGSNWNYDLKNLMSGTTAKDKERAANGNKSVYFKVTDKEENVFTSKLKADVDYTTLRLVESTTKYGVKDTTDSILYVKPETLPPDVEITGAKVKNSGSDYAVTYGSMVVGGTRDELYVKFTASDSNGIKAAGVTASADFTNDKENDSDTQTKTTVSGVVKAYKVVNNVETEVSDFTDTSIEYFIATFTPTAAIKNSNKTGTISFTVTALDAKDTPTSQSQTISYDFKKPVVGFKEPADTVVNSGSITAYGSVSENSVLEYAVSLSSSTSPYATKALADAGTAIKAWTGTAEDTITAKSGTATTGVRPYYMKLSDYGTSWFIYFDGTNAVDGNVHDKQLKDWFIDAGVTTAAAIETNDSTKFTDIVDTYLWIKATDDVGNVSEVSRKIRVDSQGDRPTVTISYPNKAGIIVGDTVNIYGSAEPKNTNEMKYVWVQLIKGYNPESPSAVTKDDLDLLKSKNYPVYKISYPTTEWNGSGTPTEYAIKIETNGSTGWKLQLKKDLVGNTKTNMGISVYAQDAAGHLSQKVTQYLTFDASSPVIHDVYLKQYVGNEVKVTRKYVEPETESDKMWLSTKYGSSNATWKLSFKVKDTDLRSISFGGETKKTYATAANVDEAVEIELSPQSYNTKIEALDSTNNHPTINFMVGFDSTAPVLPATESKISKSVTNSNGYYKFESSAVEDESGIDFVAFYFKRENNVFDVMLPQKDSSGSAYTGNKVAVTDDSNKGAEGLYWLKPKVKTADENSVTVKGVYVNAHRGGIVRIKGAVYLIDAVETTGSGATGTTKITINGSIEALAEDSEIELALANIVNNTTRESAGDSRNYTRGYGYGYATPINDDHDLIIEYLSKQNEWLAGINSRNIPDGPVELHYVVYDKAGNYKDKTITGLTVSNNAPRIAGVQIRTDYDGDGLFTSTGETISDYSAATISSGSVTGSANSKNIYDPDEENTTSQEKNPISYTGSTQFVIAGPNNGTAKTGFAIFKGKTEIEPEIVGGNGQIKYTHTWTKSDGNSVAALTNSTATNFITGSDDYTIKTGVITLQVGDLLKAGEAKTVGTVDSKKVCTNPHNLVFTFSDSTDTTAQTAQLSMYFGVNVKSENAAESIIFPFYWKSAEDNSIYGSTTGTTIKTLKGHIELPDDWKNGNGYNSSATSGEYDGDPKVSGKVVVKGSASDSGRITELLINIPNMDLTDLTTKYLVTTVSNGTTTKSLTTTKPESGTYETYYQVAVEQTVNNIKKLVSKASEATKFTGKGYQFIIDADSNTYTADGHTVAWTLNWDTEKLARSNYNTQNDLVIKVLAVNQGEPSCIGQATQNAQNTLNKGLTAFYPAVTYPNPKYAEETFKVDVVPYVTSLETTLSAADPDNSSVYGRSASGSYPVYYYATQRPSKTDKDIITANGFNLTGGVVTFTKFDTSVTTNYTSSLTADTNDGNKLKFTLPFAADNVTTNAKSGDIYITVGGVDTLNNKNNNGSKGSYTTTSTAGTYNYYKGYYNHQANNMNNDTLTDDLSISIWQLNAQAVSVTSDLTRPVMHVNPTNGMLGFAYANGNDFKMPNGNDNSYTNWCHAWNAFNSIGFTYDTKGNTFGVEMGTDSNSSGGNSKFRIVSNVWGSVDGNEYGNNNCLRLESHCGDAARFDYHPKLVATNPDANNANVYLMYYDPDSYYSSKYNGNELKLRCGKIPLEALTNAGDKKDDAPQNTDDHFGDFYDDAKNHQSKNETNYANCSVVANKSGDATKTYKPGSEYSIAVIPAGTLPNGKTADSDRTTTDTLVAAWVDPINDKVVYGYLENPLVNNHKKKDASGNLSDATDATPNNMWHLESICDYAGGYCAIAADNKGGIHIAYYSKERSGSLKYTYIPTYNGTKQTYFVDSYGATGRNLTIDFAYDGSKYIPYIGYYTSMKKPKYAYPTSGTLSNGADEENMYLGTWESMYISTLSSIDAEDNIQIGVYRESSTSSADYGKRKTISSRTDNVGGNNTDNPIVAYATSYVGNGYVETAQLR